MSKADQQKSSSRRSKMDRYTEDLKYSLRRRLSDSVGKGHLRTDDILARSHRQIVADFTDPRQWYYSATHDYVIGLMRESQRELIGPDMYGNRVGGSRGQNRRVMISRGNSSPGYFGNDNQQRRKRSSFVGVPTETSVDLDEIRGRNGKGQKASAAKKRGGVSDGQNGRVENEVSGRLDGTAVGVDTMNKGTPTAASEQLVVSNRSSLPTEHTHLASRRQSLPEFKANNEPCLENLNESLRNDSRESESKGPIPNDADGQLQLPEVLDSFNDSSQISVEPNADFIQSVTVDQGATSFDDYSTLAMEAYRASKHSILSQSSTRSRKSKSPVDEPTPSYFPGLIEPFLPIKRRNEKIWGTRPGVNLPLIGIHANDALDSVQHVGDKALKIKRGRIQGRKHSVGPKKIVHRTPGREDVPYVEDWIRKLHIDDRRLHTFAPNNPLKPIVRVDNTYPHIPVSRRYGHDRKEQSTQYQNMSLPPDFQPVDTFPPFQPLTSLYLYSLKQRSDLNLKLQYLQIARPVRHNPGLSEQLRMHTFDEDLKKARSKMDHIESKLGELYDNEVELGKVLVRENIKLHQRQPVKTGNTVHDTKLTTRSEHHIMPVESHDYTESVHNVSESSLQAQSVELKAEKMTDKIGSHNVVGKLNAQPSKTDSQNQSHVGIIRLSLLGNGPSDGKEKEAEGSGTVTKSANAGEAYHAASTSPWNQYPMHSAKPREMKSLRAKTLRVFEKAGQKSDDTLDCQATDGGKDREVISSVRQCNTTSNDNEANLHGNETDQVSDDEKESAEYISLGPQTYAYVMQIVDDVIEAVVSSDKREVINTQETQNSTGIETIDEVLSPNDTADETNEQSTFNDNHSDNKMAPPVSRMRSCSICEEPHKW